jgi:hypothetical protein
VSEHNDDLESSVHEGAVSESDTYPQTEEEVNEADDEEVGDENEKPNPADDESEL